MKVVLVSLVAFLLTSNVLIAQEGMLSAFTGDVSGGKVLLAWTIQSGNTCNGVDVYRSTDSITFTKIGDIPGVCGDLTSSKNYTHTDDAPEKNASNYYKLDLGGQEYSWVIKVEVIDLSNQEIIIRPNPANFQAQVLFNNDNNLEYLITVYDNLGAKINQFTTNQNQLILSTENWRNGLYFVDVLNEQIDRRVRGKLIVHH